MNSVNLVGRLTADIELRRTGSGKAVASYSLAVKRPRAAETTDFIEVVTWEQGAEYLAKYAHKGDVVAVDGSLQSRKWTDNEGKNHTAWEVVAASVELLSSRKNNEGSSQPAKSQNSFNGGYGGAAYNQQGFDGYKQGDYPAQDYQPPVGGFKPLNGDDEQFPF